MNITITPTAEALIRQLIELGHDNPETIIEQALQDFYRQQLIDTSIGFPDLTESEIIQDNEHRWQTFQQNPNGIAQTQVETWFADRRKSS
ncbi:hypothetical protein [Leptolyngbya sp. NIES-2104]|uniref:hypothetical protein n=1 Tax=Leptolyngbya sp. NIES-2104 TaxID=1552121 RepID=UPI0006ECC2A2|nr:hypothetical protein [Leptolyngbya sp. NIES-2104]GAP93958.1 hypothetical protein NIES2104_04670 [Leptolyngbya sp. NIES-2104]